MNPFSSNRPLSFDLTGLPDCTPENVQRLTDKVMVLQERLEYVFKVYVVGMNNIAATQMYVAFDMLEPSPIYRHNLKRFVKEAVSLHEKYDRQLQQRFSDKESKYFFSDFYIQMEKHFTPLTMKLRATAMNIANDLHQDNATILASMVVAERLLHMASLYYDKAIEKTIEIAGLRLNFNERYQYISFKKIHMAWENAVRQMSEVPFANCLDIHDICSEIVSLLMSGVVGDKAAEAAATLNKANFPEVYQEIQDMKVRKLADKLDGKYKVSKLKKK